MAAKMLASALLVEGKHVASFPMYGFERRGAPVVAFTRFDDKPIREKTQVYNPDCIIVIDPGLLTLPTLFTGLKENSVFLLNTAKKEYKQPSPELKTCALVNATGIAMQEIGRDIPNTTLLGAFAAATGWLSLEAVLKSLPEYLSGDILQRNLKSAERGYKEVEVIKW
jgi:2-oxoacid:acceptor oxidoreductase gamma subunit (pyruvate/2-ketoisovalerate family)